MKKIIMTMLLVSSVAAAKTETTQTLVPLAGQSEFIPTLNYIGMTFEFDNANSIASTGSGTMAQVKYYYGLTDNHALGGSLAMYRRSLRILT